MPTPKRRAELSELDKKMATKKKMVGLTKFAESVAELEEFDTKMEELAALKRLEEVGAREIQEEGVEAAEKRQKKEKSGRTRGANDSEEEEEDVEMPAPKRMGRSELSLSDRLSLVEESGEPGNVDEKMLDASSNVEARQY